MAQLSQVPGGPALGPESIESSPRGPALGLDSIESIESIESIDSIDSIDSIEPDRLPDKACLAGLAGWLA